MPKYIRTFTLLAALVFLLVIPLMFSCALIQPQPLKTTVLSQLMWHGKVVGIEVPAKYGDFSIDPEYSFHPMTGDPLTLIEWISRKDHIIHQMFVMTSCPVPIVLRSYIGTDKNVDDWIIEYWIYDGLKPVKATEKQVDEALEQNHVCPPVEHKT